MPDLERDLPLSVDDAVTRICVVNYLEVRFGYVPHNETFTCTVFYANSFFQIVQTTGRSAAEAANAALDYIEGRG